MSTLPRCLMSLTLVVLGSAPVKAQSAVQRACTPSACVDIWSESGSAEAGHVMRLRVYNQTAEMLEPFTFIVRHVCAGGAVEERPYSVSMQMPPNTELELTSVRPVCVGTWQPPMGASVGYLPGMVATTQQAPGGAVPRTPDLREPLLDDPSDPWWPRTMCTGPLCLCVPDGTLSFGSCGSGGGGGGGGTNCDLGDGDGGGKAVLVVIALVAVTVVLALLALAVLAVGALFGAGVGWGTAKLLKKQPLAGWANALIMDGALMLGLLAGGFLGLAGGLGSVMLWQQRSEIAKPAAVVLASGSGLAALGVLGASALVGTATVIGANAIIPPDEEPTPAPAVEQTEQFIQATPVPAE